MKNKSALSLIFLTVFIDLLGFGILIPILPAFAKKVLLIDETAIGIALAVYSLLQFIFNPIFGKLSDKYGRKPLIVISLFINAAGYVLFAFTHSFLMLIISRVVGGIGGSSIAVAQAYIADITTKENRSKGMGMIGAAFGLGFVFGPLIGGLLSGYGYMATGFGAAAFSFIAFLLTMAFLPESNLNRTIDDGTVKRKILNITAIQKTFANKNLAILILLFFILTFSFANIYGTFALLGIQVYGFTDLQNGYMFGIVGLSSAVVQGRLIGPITKMLGKKRILLIGSSLIMIMLALIPYAGNFLWLAVVSILLSIGTGMLQPTLLSLISEVASDSEQGMTLGVNQSLSALARMFGPLWGGFAYEFLGYQFPFLTGALFMMLVVGGAVFYIPKRIKLSS